MILSGLAAACGGSAPSAKTSAASIERADARPTGLSPWWASLFEEGAVSQWVYTYDHNESEVNDEGEWVETVSEHREADVRCTVSNVRREGALWASTVTCAALDPSVEVSLRGPAGDWFTDGGTRLYHDTLPPESPTLTDPPSQADLRAECLAAESAPDGRLGSSWWPDCEHVRASIQLTGETWCLHYSPIDGGSHECFLRGVGPSSYGSESAPSGRTTTESLSRR
ncbi:MAG: hypothetical protein IT385_24995 [Deltaproteobacteria bacterium]|nr:hypothetical protein [Deltaproteobacteria bacterium]